MKKNLHLIGILCFLGFTVFGQVEITGNVQDEQGEPLIGAAVRVLDVPEVGTVTDFNGNFEMTLPDGSDQIEVSYLGFQTQVVALDGRTNLLIVLKSDSQLLDEVVVVAYGEVKKTDFTGSATTVSARSLEKRPISNPLVALQGAGTGVQTTAPGGTPGSSPGILVRGIGSYSASSSALVVVDGVEYSGGLANINPDDVESITVLKDAATIALFGSRGANGVIMVTTKKGNIARSGFNVKIQMGGNQNGTPNYNTVNAAEYYELMWEAYKNSLHYGELGIPMDVAAQIASGTLPRNADGDMEYEGNTFGDMVEYVGNYNVYDVPNDQLISTDGKINPNARLLYGDDLNWLDQASQTGKRNEYGISYTGGFGQTDF